jgi:predicted RNA-binding Zn-ribbon protein involved in translation (DUF1610 family)
MNVKSVHSCANIYHLHTIPSRLIEAFHPLPPIRKCKSIFNRAVSMKLSCNHLCRLKEIFVNLTCPKCFSAQISLCEEETEDNAACEMCGCEFKFNPELPRGGMD